MTTLFIPNSEDMERLGQRLALHCPNPMLIFLVGDLGAGKTTVVRGFLRGLGHQGSVKSPTFTLVEPYEVNERTIFHFDLYRLEDPEELEAFGIRDYLGQPAITFIEWPERAKDILPTPDLYCYISLQNEGRNITFQSHSERGLHLIQQMMQDGRN